MVILDNLYLDRVDKALQKATKNVSKAIDLGDYDTLKKALDESEDSVDKAVDS